MICFSANPATDAIYNSSIYIGTNIIASDDYQDILKFPLGSLLFFVSIVIFVNNANENHYLVICVVIVDIY